MNGVRAALSLLLIGLSLVAAPAARGGEQVWGVQLHLHGSLSEGAGSMRGHGDAARELGGAVDVLWWTDHDWRIAGYTYVTGFDFERGLREIEQIPAPLRVTQWEGPDSVPLWAHSRAVAGGGESQGMQGAEKGWRRLRVAHPARQVELAVSTDEARQGRRSLRMAIEGQGAAWESATLGFRASRRRQVASLASGVRLRVSLEPMALHGDARLVMSALLSQQPPDRRARIDYRLTSAGAAAVERVVTRVQTPARGGAGRRLDVARIDLPFEMGVWNDFVLDLTADAERQGLGGIDNSLTDFALSVEARSGGRMVVYVDRFEIERATLGKDLFGAEKKLAEGLSDGSLRNYVGQEVSYAAHLNLFGPRIPLADVRTHPHGYTPEEAVALAHEHGGIVSLNHFFGISTDLWGYSFPNDRVERLIAARGHGADLLEVGYRRRGYDLAAFLKLWDRLSAASVVMTGVGVSDSHDNDLGWSRGPNNFITWVLAESSSEGALIEALRAGRAFFGDPTRFAGRMEIEEETGARMGQVVVGAGRARRVQYRVEGLRSGQRVALIHDGRTSSEFSPQAGRFETSETIDSEQTHFVRFEVRERGEPVALSNPIYFLKRAPEGGLAPARRP